MDGIKDKVVRLGGTSLLIFGLVIGGTRAKQAWDERGVKADQPADFQTQLETLDIKVAGLNRLFDVEQDDIDWAFHEKLEAQKLQQEEEPEPPPVEAEPETVEVEADVPPPAVELTLEERIAALDLTGIAWSDEQPLAFINGKVLRRNDEIDGLVVVDIQPSSIRLLDATGKFAQMALYER